MILEYLTSRILRRPVEARRIGRQMRKVPVIFEGQSMPLRDLDHSQQYSVKILSDNSGAEGVGFSFASKSPESIYRLVRSRISHPFLDWLETGDYSIYVDGLSGGQR